MKTALLTSSRADYSVYLPLLKKIAADSFFDLHLLVFGTHLCDRFGKTVDIINKDGFRIFLEINTTPDDDTPASISRAMAKTMIAFSHIWEKNSYDLTIVLGDRYEMFAAAASMLPFNIRIAHIHGGETTLGAIDNSLRHSITHMASIHFTASEAYREKVIMITGKDKNVFNTGALSIDNLTSHRFLTTEQLREKTGVDFSIPTILITWHPETINFINNRKHIREIIKALDNLREYQHVITMPNADTNGLMIREELKHFISGNAKAFGFNNLGPELYPSCMKYCTMMLGNSSSGFIEASWFPKPVVNIGTRQQGRIVTPNIVNCVAEANHIVQAVRNATTIDLKPYDGLYGDGNASEKMINQLKRFLLAENDRD